ncbi:molybdate ABC transporter substrate-binding protein [Desulfonatronum sp. SC1]|uniref:molybdate ABC transporter substrate-binding protein n=1 Tax=Desulfonatronum sp. SC1 TaxID=2109626 RepID=UPI000D2F9CDA|nr:molybdate ABC transporter substrate-binding protein [Desulfonatronum sp. SC1]PTN37857.1 molybdate ABC transporter substrate-binding protein [Desulfonatronum sp. SC1]
MKKIGSLLFSCILFCVLAAPAAAQELVVSAAASLTNAFNDIKAEFEQINPGVLVTPNYAASGALFRQIEQGAPVDVFASADLKWMNDMIAAGFVEENESVLFAQNTLVLAVSTASRVAISGVADLTGEQVRRIGVGTPATVPVGNYSKIALEGLGMWDVLQPKMIFAESVRQVLDYVQRGEVDAGLMYATDAAQGGERVQIVATLPLPEPVSYPIAPLKNSKQSEMGRKFIQFILSDQGQDILAGYGFSRPE